MTTSITKDILLILNNDMLIENKRIAFAEMRKRKRGHNRHLIEIVYSMIDSHMLPLRHDEPLRIREKDFTEKEYNQLKGIILNSKCSYFNVVCGETLWMQKHDVEIVRIALLSYEKELANPSITNEYFYTELTVGLCRLYSKCKIKDFNFASFLQKSIQHVRANYDVSGYGILFILNALLGCNENSEQVVLAFEDAISYYESKNILDKAVSFLENLEEFYKNNKCQKELKTTRIRIAQTEEKLANKYDWQNPNYAHIIISHIHSAMNAWNRADEKVYKSERQRLAKRIEPIKKLSLQTMKVFSSGEIDLSEWLKVANQFIENATLESFIYQMSKIIPLENYESAKQKLQNRGSFLTGLFPSVTLDSEGRKKRIIPSVINASKTEMNAILQNEAAEIYKISADIYVNRLLYLARGKFVFTKETLRFLVEDNLFIPSNHQESFLLGLVAGFNLDLITAMHLLMPQVECCIRSLAEECGAVVYKTDKQGIEECLSLTKILELPEVNECFDETFLFNLKLFFTSVYGFGMRDDVCHGLHSDPELQSTNCLATWWFVLHICCLYSRNLNKRLREQKQI